MTESNATLLNNETSQAQTFSIRTKVVIAFTAISILSLAILGTTIFISYRQQVRNDFRLRLLNLVKLASLQQNAELHSTIQNAGDEELDAYKEIKSTNAAIVATDPDIAYLYTMRSNNLGTIYFVVDTGQPGDNDTASVAELYTDASPLLVSVFDTLDKPIAEEDFYTDQWGTFLSAYAPFYAQDGSREGILGVDINASKVLEEERAVLWRIVTITIISILIVILLAVYIGNIFTKPIINLAQVAQKIMEGDLNVRTDINTSDEVGELARIINQMTSQLQLLFRNLEMRVDERTKELLERNKDLDTASQQIQKRASQFEALAQVAQSISAIRNPKELLPEVTRVISEHYGFYHVGVFLIDETREYAVLTAANSEGGMRMLDRKHRLKIGEQGIVGSVTSTGNPRIALDVGSDAIYFNNPDLPNTHSEMALPLMIENQVAGALDVQSTEREAFSNEDVQTLSLLAEQVSLAIENARLFENLRKTLAELQTVSRQSVRENWRHTPEKLNLIGYRYDSMGASPLKEPVPVKKDTNNTQPPLSIEQGPFVVPIKVRGEVIGELLVQSPSGEKWSTDEQDLINAVAERVALSAENARLFEETTQRAERERLVSEITSKIRSHTDPQAMIETAASELREILGATRVEIVSQSTGKKDTEV